MNNRECLKLLNLDSAATGKDLKLAYRKAVKQWHPDRHQQASEEIRSTVELRMQALNKAYTTLSKYYDKHGHMPGYFVPEDETPFTDDVTATGAQSESSYQQADQNQDHQNQSPGSASTRGRSSSGSQKRGTMWLVMIVLVIVIFYLFGDFLGEPTETAMIATERKTPTASVADTPMEQKVSTEDADAAENEEHNSPFDARERKSAFEPDSSLGIYEESADEKYFTYGDTAGRVFEIQGVPSRTVGDIWYYGMSEVHFQEGRVKSWYMAKENKLRAR